MTDPAQTATPAQNDGLNLPDLLELVRQGEWRRALAVSRLQPAEVPVQEALSAINGVQEAIRARRYPAARRYLAEYRACVQDAATGELSVIRRQLDPGALEAALSAIGSTEQEAEPEALADSLAPALALPLTRAEALNMQGVLCILHDQREQARAFFEQAMQADPSHYRALTNLGNLELEAGQYPQAEDIYRQVIKLNPEYDGGHHNLGVALRRQGKVSQAVSAIRRGQRLSLKRTREDADAEMKEQFGSNPMFKWLRWALFAVVALLLYVSVRGVPH